MTALVVLIGMLLLEWLPRFIFFWATARYDDERPDLRHTGEDIARRLLSDAGLERVAVEPLPANVPDFGDNYDPKAKIVRLSAKVAGGRSVAAYAVAAHEVGHAIQDARRDGSMAVQHALYSLMRWTILVALGLIVLADLVLDERPAWVQGIFWVGFLLPSLLFRLVTLRVEWAASFEYALPLLAREGLLAGRDMNSARVLLGIAAVTYAGVAAASVLLVGYVVWDECWLSDRCG